MRNLCVVLVVASATLLFRSDALVAQKPMTEDGHYVLTVARSLAAGDGFSVEGTPTTGVQPMFTVLVAPAFWLTDDPYVSLRVVILLQLLLWGAAAITLGSIAARASPHAGVEQERHLRWVASFLFLSSTYLWMQCFNGLETGLYLFVLAATWRVSLASMGAWPKALTTGVFLGFCVLARVDAVLIVGPAALLLAKGAPRMRLAQAASTCAMAALVSSPWWLYVYATGDGLMPSSGLAQLDISPTLGRVWLASSALFQAMVPHVYTSHYATDWMQLIRLGLGLLLIWSFFSRRNSHERPAGFGSAVALGAALLALWYAATSMAIHFYPRYLAPLALVGVMMLVFVLGPWLARRRLIVLVVIAAPCLGAVVISHTGKFSGNPRYSEQLPLVEAYVPPGDWVGAGQSGTLGYFRNKVLNLDGKVNAEALDHRGSVDGYLRTQGVRWFCDDAAYTERLLGPDPPAQGWEVVAARGRFTLYRRVDEHEAGR
ncbi:MAG: hypothetical protein KJO07_06625 [Deltaproteobacteria bacterium]|nr:hypothetical protein [Deltaproteobacteria bacterium]